MKKILLYGFSGFDRYPRNPSRDVVTALARQRFAGVLVDAVILKVSYDHVARRIPRLLAKKDYDAVIGFGLARGSSGIRLEKEARNRIDSRTADVDGSRPRRRKIIRGAPECYRSPVALTRLRAALLSKKIPAVLSHDAGGYVCNFTYYHVFHHLRAHGSRAACLFVHLPLTTEIAARRKDDTPSLPRKVVQEAATMIVKRLTTR